MFQFSHSIRVAHFPILLAYSLSSQVRSQFPHVLAHTFTSSTTLTLSSITTLIQSYYHSLIIPVHIHSINLDYSCSGHCYTRSTSRGNSLNLWTLKSLINFELPLRFLISFYLLCFAQFILNHVSSLSQFHTHFVSSLFTSADSLSYSLMLHNLLYSP